MTGYLWGLLALALLAAGMAAGWRRWIAPQAGTLDVQAKGMLALAILAVAGGLIGAPFWWLGYRESFSWVLPPLASRMLAAAAVAFGVAGWLALDRMQGRLVRLYLVLIAVYLAPLVVAIVLLHLDRFDWAAPITYGFFVIAGGMSIAALWHLIRRTELGPVDAAARSAPDGLAPPVVRGWMWLVAAVTGPWGAALFVLPGGPWRPIWVWPQDPLTSRLIATMLLTLCAGAVLGAASREGARMMLWTFAAYGVGVTAAGLMNQVAGKPIPLAYVAVFAVIALMSLLLQIRLRPAAAN